MRIVVSDIIFYGPVDMRYGPGIKNAYTVDALKSVFSVKVLNTYMRPRLEKIKNFFYFMFTTKKTIIAVSSRGRSVLLPIAYLKKCLCRKFKYSVISINGYIIHEFTSSNRLKNLLLKKGLKKADKVFVEVDGLKRQLETQWEFNIISWFPNFKPDTEFVSYNETFNSKKSEESTVRCVFLARVCMDKGIDVAIQAVQNLRDEGLDVSLDIFGPVHEDSKSLIDSLNSVNGIRYCGVIENKEVTNTLKDYSLFLFPTRHKREGFPASLIDAFSAGLPVIATDISYNSELVVDHKGGIICELNSVGAMSDAIRFFYEKPEKLREYGMYNYDLAKQFRSSKVFSDFIKEIEAIGWL